MAKKFLHNMLGILTVNDIKYGDSFIGHGQIPLKAPNVKFDFNVSVSNCMLSTDTSKLNLTLGTFSGICPGGF